VRAELGAPAVFRLFDGEWDKLHVVETIDRRQRDLERRSIADRASAQGRDPQEAMRDLVLAKDLCTTFVAQRLNSDEEAVSRMLNHPHCIVSLSLGPGRC
jgi:N-acyl-D-aspartate/D-glutamate deacylase